MNLGLLPCKTKPFPSTRISGGKGVNICAKIMLSTAFWIGKPPSVNSTALEEMLTHGDFVLKDEGHGNFLDGRILSGIMNSK